MDKELKEMFSLILQKLDGVDRRFESMEARLDGMDRRFDAVEARLDGMDRRFESQEGTFPDACIVTNQSKEEKSDRM